MRRLVIMALWATGCTLSAAPETCNGLDDDGDGCVDLLYDPQGADGPAAWGAILVEACDSGGWSACREGEWLGCAEEIDVSGWSPSCL